MKRNRYYSKYSNEDIVEMISDVRAIITQESSNIDELFDHIGEAQQWADSDSSHSIVRKFVFYAAMVSTSFKVEDGFVIIKPDPIESMLLAYKGVRRKSSRKDSCYPLFIVYFKNPDTSWSEYTARIYKSRALKYDGSFQFGWNFKAAEGCR